MEYKVGILTRPSDDDILYDEIEDADEAALNNSIDDDVWAVWDVHDGELMSIAYQRTLFTK